MATQLTLEQRHDLQRAGDQPTPVVDPVNQKVYFLVAGDLFERIRVLLDDEFDVRDTYAAQAAALANVWSDPALDAYNDDALAP